MEAYRTEEEQLEALRRWWREQGRSTLLIIAVAIAAVFGYRAWSEQQAEYRQQVAGLYQGLLSADQQLDQGEPTAGQLQTARHLAKTLRDEHGDTTYARLAALFQAKYALRDDQPDAAAAALQWVIQQDSADALAQLARLRLARVHYAQGDAEAALAALDSGDPGSYAAAYSALRGDVLHAGGDIDGATAAWRQSATLAGELAEPVRDPVLQLKLDNVAAADGAVPAAAAESANADREA